MESDLIEVQLNNLAAADDYSKVKTILRTLSATNSLISLGDYRKLVDDATYDQARVQAGKHLSSFVDPHNTTLSGLDNIAAGVPVRFECDHEADDVHQFLVMLGLEDTVISEITPDQVDVNALQPIALRALQTNRREVIGQMAVGVRRRCTCAMFDHAIDVLTTLTTPEPTLEPEAMM